MDLMTYLLAIQKIQEVSSDTTYTLTADVQNKTIVLTPSVGTAQVITVPYATDASTVNGKNVPELENGKIPASYLPSYVDDVEEYEDQEHFPSTGESNKIYIDLTTNKIYRWSGTTYVEISESLALGETSSTAFRGDHGKTAYNHSLITSGNPHNVTKTDIGLDNVGNFKAVSTVASQGLTTTEQENAKANIGLGVAADKDIDISIEESSQSTNLPTTKAVSDFVQTQTDKVVGTIKSVSNLPAPIASFSGAAALPMPKLEVAIEPQQDLHGYDAPWVGGAGKNKLPFPYANGSTDSAGMKYTVNDDGTVLANGTPSTTRSCYLLQNATNVYAGMKLNGALTGTSLQGINITVQYYDGGVFREAESCYDGQSLTIKSSDTINIYIRCASGVQVNNMLFKPMLRLATETDDSFAPYSNICPISGWDEVNVGVVGKNLCKSTIHGYVSSTDNLIIIDNDTESAIFYAFEGKTYTISSSATMNKSRLALVGTDIVENYTPILQREILADNVNTWTATWTGWTVWYKCSSRQTAFDNSTQVELGTTATTYEPYNGHTYTIDLDGTVYGGTLDLVSGVMTVDRASIKLNDLNWTKQNTISGNWRFISSQLIQNIKVPTDASWKIDNLCSVYQNITANETWTAEKTGIAINADGKLLICDLNQADTTALGVVIANQTYCYELATPLTIQLTPTVVKSLLVSNVWSDTGNILDAQYISYEYDKICAKYSENIIPTDDFALNTTTGDITTDGDIIRKNGYWGGTYGGTHTSLIDAIDDLYNLIQQNNS